MSIVLFLATQRSQSDEKDVELPFESARQAFRQTSIDRAVFAKLRQEKIQPAHVCSDAVFVRRVFLDLIGTLPTADEARQFILDQNPRKRVALVDHLMEREEFADYWAMRWADVLRVRAEFPINMWPNAVQAIHRWIRKAVKENMPYDQFARELLTSSGSNFRVPQVNFYRSTASRDPDTLARSVALAFMGVRAEKWPEEKQKEMAVFFSRVGYKRTAEWKEEIIFFDLESGIDEANEGKITTGTFPDGSTVRLEPHKDPRVTFADWLITPRNPWFARCMVNRVWFWLMGRGIIHEPDDIRPDNPADCPRVLETLQRELLASHYDVRKLLRLIMMSKVYQQSSIPQSDNPKVADYFGCYRLQRLDAEILIDAICQITGTTEEYSSAIPEPFTFIPGSQRTMALADGSITSPFLDMFGRPARDAGLLSERNNRPSANQSLHLLNSSHIQKKIEQGPKMRALLRSSGKPQEVVVKLYLTILSRPPTPQELKLFLVFASSDKTSPQEAQLDLAWALMNSVEFVYRH